MTVANERLSRTRLKRASNFTLGAWEKDRISVFIAEMCQFDSMRRGVMAICQS